MKDTKIISAFPGVGKSTFAKDNSQFIVLDSDSTAFSKLADGSQNPEFPNNYISHIKSNLGIADYILVSTHKEVRNLLVENELSFTLICPFKNLKMEYLSRYKQRGSPLGFIDLMNNKWDEFLDDCYEQLNCDLKIDMTGGYLSDIIDLED